MPDNYDDQAREIAVRFLVDDQERIAGPLPDGGYLGTDPKAIDELSISISAALREACEERDRRIGELEAESVNLRGFATAAKLAVEATEARVEVLEAALQCLRLGFITTATDLAMPTPQNSVRIIDAALSPEKEVTCWFVEDARDGRCEGWFTAPEIGMGGWLTTDPLKAKQYTRAEAEAVACALTYFNAPLRWSKWIATEHIFSPEKAEVKE